MQNFQDEGYFLCRAAFHASEIIKIHDELLEVGNILNGQKRIEDLDNLWNYHKGADRNRASSIYNGFKYLPSIQRLASSTTMHEHLKKICGIRLPALVDINCRIDSAGEDKFLFDWHQDYWFSICSPNAVVVWIPVTPLIPSTGGLQLISNIYTDSRIFKTKAGSQYRSYADAVLLNESLPSAPMVCVNEMAQGDVLFFKFNTLHKSMPVGAKDKSRFTIQLRFADYLDPDFISAKYRPGTVNEKIVDYTKKENP